MSKIIKNIFKIILLPYYIVKITIKGFLKQMSFFIKGFKINSLLVSRGFYFYFIKVFKYIKKKTNIESLQKVINYFEIKKEQPSHIVLIMVWIVTLMFLFDSLYIDNKNMIDELPTTEITDTVKKEDKKKDSSKDNEYLSTDFNLYRIYGKYKLEDININELKKKNADTVAWIIVEGTNINYPIVQTDNNDYYLNHSYDHSYTYNGWTFMDFRNDNMLSDDNTIFYGHNLLNGTAFGTMKKIFDSPKNNKIMVITSDQQRYTYQVFSAYTIDPEVYYLQTNFTSKEEYSTFLETIRNRNTIAIDNSVTTNDRIITLSTCTEDNQGRRVIHAKLIS